MYNKLAISILAALVFATCTSLDKNVRSSYASLPSDSVLAIAKDAYVFALPLALMDITRRMMTNVSEPVQRLSRTNQSNCHLNFFS